MAAAVRDERDPLAIRGEARMDVQGDTARLRQALRFPSGCGQPIDVAQEVEGDPLAVRGEVDRHPGAFRGGEVDLPHLASGLGHVPGSLCCKQGNQGERFQGHLLESPQR